MHKSSAGQKSQSIVKDFIETYQIQFDQMESDIVHKDTLIEGYQAEIQSLREEMKKQKELLDRLFDLQGEHSRLRQDHEAVLKSKARLEDEVKDQTRRIEDLEQQAMS